MLDGLSYEQTLEATNKIPELHEHQFFPVRTEWRTWVVLGGRGAGKTFAGGWWFNYLASQPNLTLALVGPALHDVREVMIEGPSGIMAQSLSDRRPRWEASRKRLVWDSGTVAYAFSAEDPESLRGPQFHAAWADEFCAWREPERVLNTLRFGLRLGEEPQLLVTTTPRPIAALRRLLRQPGTTESRGMTAANVANLSPGFLEHLKSMYAGTQMEAQEMQGLIVETGGALFRAEDLARARGSRPAKLERIVVAVDPPITAGGDACGIVVAGRRNGVAYVLADRSQHGLSPNGWANRAMQTAVEFGAHQVLAEANQGGEMVRTLLARTDLARAGLAIPVRLVHATRGKKARAEPVAALYEQGKVVHCDAFPALEEEMMALGGDELRHSPDRADALVWAITELMLEGREGPRIRQL